MLDEDSKTEKPQTSVATWSGHLDYPGHLGHFLAASKWVSPIHAYMPDPDQNYLSCASKTAMKRLILSSRAVTSISTSVATGSGHSDYLGHFLPGLKWVSPGHAYMPDPDQNCLVVMCIKNCNERSILSNRAVTNISRMRS